MHHYITDSGERHTKMWPDIYLMVRAGFIQRGTTLAQWCRDNGITRQYADRCLKGEHIGPKGAALRRRLASAAGVSLA